MHPREISILDYTYSLPENRIANFPVRERDASKLLIYKDGGIMEDHYRNIAAYLPGNSMLVLNDTRVIQARILFQKPSGGIIEIFCLEPDEVINEYSTIMNKTASVRWKCMIGGASKWKQGSLQKKAIIGNMTCVLEATLVEKLPDAYIVNLTWLPASFCFAEVLEHTGNTPLPPYIKRMAGETDKERYQTIYARYDGSVAAPTAGLHFTPAVFAGLKDKGISAGYVTLHVGAGTFKPVKAQAMLGHEMHAEWINVTTTTIAQLATQLEKGIIAVGTTSVRTLESLYWMGVKSILFPGISAGQLRIQQWEVYEEPLSGSNIKADQALRSLLTWMEKNNCDHLFTPTQILIAPGYRFRIPIAIITNFHQPQSTLLLLVAAAIGNKWKNVYDYALDNDFRFLSYGDGCLLFLEEQPYTYQHPK